MRDELVPLLEKYPDKQGMQTNVQPTMTEWDWNPENVRLKRLKNNILEFVNYNCNYYPVRSIEDIKSVRYFMDDFGQIYIEREIIRRSINIFLVFLVVFIF